MGKKIFWIGTVLLSVALSGVPAAAGTNVWTTSGPGGGDIQSLAIDPSNPQTIYAGTDMGDVFKSTNGGDSWSGQDLGHIIIHKIAIDGSNSQTIYVGTSGGVFKSTNGGGSWAAVNSGLTDTYVYALAIDPLSPQTIYAGTLGSGVYRSTNGGSNWTAINSGLTNTVVRSLVIDPLPSAPSLVTATGTNFQRSPTPTLNWNAVSGAASYTLEHANNSGFTGSTTVTGITATSHTVPATSVDGTYYWRVRAVASSQTVYAGTSGGGAFAFTIYPSTNQSSFSAANSFAVIPTFTEWTVILLATGMMGYMVWYRRRVRV